VSEQKLVVEYGAGRPGGMASRNGVKSDTSLGVDRNVKFRQEALEQDEGRFLADPATRLIPFGDHGVRARGLRGQSSLESRHNHIDLFRLVVDLRDAPSQHVGMTDENDYVESSGSSSEDLREEVVRLGIDLDPERSSTEFGDVL
jgi:hypothetical protein